MLANLVHRLRFLLAMDVRWVVATATFLFISWPVIVGSSGGLFGGGTRQLFAAWAGSVIFLWVARRQGGAAQAEDARPR